MFGLRLLILIFIIRIECHGKPHSVHRSRLEYNPQFLSGQYILLRESDSRIPETISIPFLKDRLFTLFFYLVSIRIRCDGRHRPYPARIDIFKNYNLFNGFLRTHLRKCVNVGHAVRQHQTFLHNTVHHSILVHRTITGRNIPGRTESINTGCIITLAIRACHFAHITIYIEINHTFILATSEVYHTVCYPPFTLPCFRHLSKRVNQIHVVIRD